MVMQSVGFLLAIGLAIVHGFAARFPLFRIIPKTRWMSFAGGVSLTYVFLEVFPELGKAQTELQHSESIMIQYLENHVYILSLLGLIVFYLLDIYALKSRASPSENSNHEMSTHFWIHITAFALLNLITGYLIQELSHHDWFSCLLFFTAIALHFFIIDEHLREYHTAIYDRIGRWILMSMIILGAILGQATHLDEVVLLLIWSFLAGSIILNVLKRELPDENENCVVSFLVGAFCFASLLFLK